MKVRTDYAVISCKRENNYYTDTVLNVSPAVSSLSGQNTVTIQEQHKKTTDSSYSALTAVTPNTDTTIQLDNLYDQALTLERELGLTSAALKRIKNESGEQSPADPFEKLLTTE